MDYTKLIRIALFSTLLMAIAFATMAPGEDGCPACVAEVSARELYQAYALDAASADERYGGNLLLISGTIRKLEKDSRGGLYVMLKGSDYGGVLVIFSEEDAQRLGRLSEGQSVELKATVRGIETDRNVLAIGAL